jgi:hypothetical protein
MPFSKDQGLTDLVQALLKKGPSAQKKVAEAADFHMLNWGLVGGSGGRRFRDVTGVVEALAKCTVLPTIWMVDVTGVVTYFFFGDLAEITTRLESLDVAPREIKQLPEKALLKLVVRRIKDVKAGVDAHLENMRSHPEWRRAAADEFGRLVDFSQKKLDNVEILEKAIVDYHGAVQLKGFQRFVADYAITPEQFEKAWKYANNEYLPDLK